ncbi:uncharacterized protein LOC100875340 isoform X11 [Megachile rotundata]|uniref:uncharacterized protein LOC100875340 isoform X11 n=1 Tax=Megachile rotundata TaxID=143995 RepID=UPI003FD1FDB2
MSANPMCQYFPGARNALQWGCTRSECSGGTFHPRNRSRIDGTCLLVAGLQLLRINVPAYSLRGKSALLECRYDLQGDKLYSITWYKDHEEFYRYVPRGEPTKHSYRVEGVKVDHRRSDHQQVLLQNVSLHSSGQYKCEVSAEAPSFNSVSAEAHMEVVGEARHGNGVRAARTLLGDIQFTTRVGTESHRRRQNKHARRPWNWIRTRTRRSSRRAPRKSSLPTTRRARKLLRTALQLEAFKIRRPTFQITRGHTKIDEEKKIAGGYSVVTIFR